MCCFHTRYCLQISKTKKLIFSKQRSFYELDNYKIVNDRTPEDILSELKDEYDQLNFRKISPWTTTGILPVGFVNPKEKDLLGAERGIVSYFKHPMRKTFQRAGKVLTWLLRQLPETVPHFTLHKLHNLKTRVHSAAKHLCSRYKNKTGLKLFCSDVKQMFTFFLITCAFYCGCVHSPKFSD